MAGPDEDDEVPLAAAAAADEDDDDDVVEATAVGAVPTESGPISTAAEGTSATDKAFAAEWLKMSLMLVDHFLRIEIHDMTNSRDVHSDFQKTIATGTELNFCVDTLGPLTSPTRLNATIKSALSWQRENRLTCKTFWMDRMATKHQCAAAANGPMRTDRSHTKDHRRPAMCIHLRRTMMRMCADMVVALSH